MELRQLRYFMVVAEELHFGRAAARLHIAQPALSQQIQTLERALNVQLLQRTKRNVTLTDAGRLFLEEARVTLRQAEQTAYVAMLAGRGVMGRLTLGFTGTALYSVMPTIVCLYRDSYPDVDITLQEMSTEEQVHALQSSQIHVGLLYPPLRDADIGAIPLFYESLVVVLPDHHPLADLSEISLAHLTDESFVLFPRVEGPCLHDRIIGMCQQVGFSPRIAYETARPQIMIGLVAAGMGVALTFESMAYLKRPGVLYKPLCEATPEWAMAVAWRQSNVVPVVQTFLDVVCDIDWEQYCPPFRTKPDCDI